MGSFSGFAVVFAFMRVPSPSPGAPSRSAEKASPASRRRLLRWLSEVYQSSARNVTPVKDSDEDSLLNQDIRAFACGPIPSTELLAPLMPCR